MDREIENYEYMHCPKIQKSLEFVLSAKNLSISDPSHDDPGYAYIIPNHKPTDPKTQFSNILLFYWQKYWRFVFGGLGLLVLLLFIILIVLLVPKRNSEVQTETTTTRTDNPNWFSGSCIFYDNKGEWISKACDEELPYVCETETTNF
ncbi:unnamed protein product [Caenorhabditis nigoni]